MFGYKINLWNIWNIIFFSLIWGMMEFWFKFTDYIWIIWFSWAVLLLIYTEIPGNKIPMKLFFEKESKE